MAYGVGIFLLVLTALLGYGWFWSQRDPERTPPVDENAILSPADGKILLVEGGPAPDWIDGPSWRIAIFLSLLDVHVQRAPAGGLVAYSERHGGSYRPAYAPSSETNAGQSLGFESARGRLLVVRSAGFIARRVLTSVQVGDKLAAGERIGRILLGSRTEVYLPACVSLCVKAGDKVRAGESILAYWINDDG